ncbi:GNAT family N-acetyltransferase [Celerinatantimonas yamalensis]|uniref:GNAT family N-acetyltransferase n=1 Tax=Celerinatantimonas yamalensis TaxID=559956 RepID=A0ABW9GB93_9GAMM
MPKIIIRHSEVNDIPAIKNIYEGELAFGGTLQLPFPSLQKWESRLSNLPSGSYSFVAEFDGEIIGQLGFDAYQNPRRKHVGSFGMAVKDNHQGKGVGSQLLGAAIELSDNWLNLNRLEIEVYTDNKAAIKLYKKYGFQIEGESVNFAFRNGKFVNVYHMARVIKT